VPRDLTEPSRFPNRGVLIQDAGWAEGQHRWEPGRSLESEREWLLGRLRSWTELTLPMLHVREKVAGQEAHTGIPSARDGFRQNGPRRWEPLWTCFGLFRRAREAKNVVLKTGRHQFVSAETVSIRLISSPHPVQRIRHLSLSGRIGVGAAKGGLVTPYRKSAL
jgi:hypothetical protein